MYTVPPSSFSVLGVQYGTHGGLHTVGAPYIFSGGLGEQDLCFRAPRHLVAEHTVGAQ